MIWRRSLQLLALWSASLAPLCSAESSLVEQIVEERAPYLHQLRASLHRIPELRWREEETLATILAALEAIEPLPGRQLKIYDHYSGGIVADLDIAENSSAARWLFRADTDALPVDESQQHAVRSTHPGRMHACGHDIHSAMLLTACRLLAEEAELLPAVQLRFIWQRAEESPGSAPIPQSGAERLIEEGVLEGIEQVYGLHIWAKSPASQFESRPGPFFANSGRLHFTIETKGGHVTKPHQGVNSLRVAHALQVLLSDFALRTLGPLASMSLEPSMLQAGSPGNSMPARAEACYSFRHFMDKEQRQQFIEELGREVQLLAQRYRCSIAMEVRGGHPTCINSAAETELVAQRLRESDLKAVMVEPVMGGEDFACFLEERPGSFWLLGAHQEGSGDHHMGTFDPDPSSFSKGVYFWLLVAGCLESR